MPATLRQDGRVAEAGDKRTIRSGDLNDGTVVNAGNDITIFSQQVPADKQYALGAGAGTRERGRDNFVYADLKASGDGEASSAGDPIDGELVARITDSEQRHVEAEYVVDDLENLREAASDSRTERPMQPAVVPLAGEDKHIELCVRADSGSDGYELDASASSVKLYYTDIRA